MTMTTCFFQNCKSRGLVVKCDKKAGFFDGNRCYYRTLWHNLDDGKDYVILGEEAYTFRPYSIQKYEFIAGRI